MCSFRNLRKIKILLDALERANKSVSYYALDLMYDELVRTLALVPEGTYKHVRCAGLWGTYDDGLAWLKQPKNVARPKAILYVEPVGVRALRDTTQCQSTKQCSENSNTSTSGWRHSLTHASPF